VGVRLADDGPRSGPKNHSHRGHLNNRVYRFTAGARQIACKQGSYALRAESKAARATGTLLPQAWESGLPTMGRAAALKTIRIECI
jgi:hypothetical protein